MEKPPIGVRRVIPLRKWRTTGRTAYSVGRFLLLLGAAVGMAVKAPNGGTGMWIGAAFGVFWAAVTGHMALGDVRILLAGGLVLDADGFRFQNHQWRWADIEFIGVWEESDGEGGTSRRIQVTFSPDVPSPSAPSRTPMDPGDFDTGGEPLDVVLRQWRYLHREDVEPAG